MKTLVFVGGVHDGERKSIPDDYGVYLLPIISGSLDYSKERYNRKRVRGPSGEYEYMLIDGKNDDEGFRMLLDGYRKPNDQVERPQKASKEENE